MSQSKKKERVAVNVGTFNTFRVGQNHIYIRCINGIFDREITKHTVKYGVYIRFWPNLGTLHCHEDCCIWTEGGQQNPPSTNM
jgi:hypothetical protein